jgi:hypothetical protein
MIYGVLDKDLPDLLFLGKGQVFHLSGWAFSPGRAISSVIFSFQGHQQKFDQIRIPRMDIYSYVSSAGRIKRKDMPRLLRAGFAGYMSISPEGTGQKQAAEVKVLFSDGTASVIWSKEIRLLEPSSYFSPVDVNWPAAASGPPVAICMTTFNPEKESFSKQIESIRQQMFRNWICIISDDASRPEKLEEITGVLGADKRFHLIRNDKNRGFYGNNEQVMRYVPEDAVYVALSDQDDVWYPEKLAASVDFLEDHRECDLVYSDMRIVSPDFCWQILLLGPLPCSGGNFFLTCFLFRRKSGRFFTITFWPAQPLLEAG